MKSNTVKFIDLFAGLGGIRLGFEKAFKNVKKKDKKKERNKNNK